MVDATLSSDYHRLHPLADMVNDDLDALNLPRAKKRTIRHSGTVSGAIDMSWQKTRFAVNASPFRPPKGS